MFALFDVCTHFFLCRRQLRTERKHGEKSLRKEYRLIVVQLPCVRGVKEYDKTTAQKWGRGQMSFTACFQHHHRRRNVFDTVCVKQKPQRVNEETSSCTVGDFKSGPL